MIDAGAWLGDTSIQLANANKDLTVYAIEPSSRNCNFIRKRRMEKVHIINKCLSSNSKYKCKTSDYDIFSNKTYQMGLDGTNSTTIDEIWYSTGRGVQLVHLDVEGHEYECLKGAHNCIRNKQTIFVIEILNTNPDKDKIIDLFKNLKYTYKIIPESVGWFGEKGYNYLFIPPMYSTISTGIPSLI
jgi:FkbM family methyltransferase